MKMSRAPYTLLSYAKSLQYRSETGFLSRATVFDRSYENRKFIALPKEDVTSVFTVMV